MGIMAEATKTQRMMWSEARKRQRERVTVLVLVRVRVKDQTSNRASQIPSWPSFCWTSQ